MQRGCVLLCDHRRALVHLAKLGGCGALLVERDDLDIDSEYSCSVLLMEREQSMSQ